MSQINKKNVLTLKQIKTIKKKIVRLKNYENNKFYKKSLTCSFIFLQNLQSSNLLATLIANELSKIKRHNFFFRFLKEALELIKINSLLKLKGIKIQIKGRINGRPRAKKKTIIIGKNVPILSMVTDVDYSEKVSYTANGTLGIKVWTF
jgi:ribosomal protein S3